jgi:hypothetical protein
MKKTIKPCVFLAICILGMLTFINAQVSVGAKGGLNVSNLSGIDEENFKTKALLGFHVGGFVTFNLGRNFAIQPELLYSTEGGTIEGNNITENIRLNYFNIPVMVKFLTNKGFYVEAGPQLGFRTGELSTDEFESDVKNSDFSICGGLGFQPTKSPFGIGARYNVGLGNTGSVSSGALNDADFSSGVFQLSLYWRLFGGGKLKK